MCVALTNNDISVCYRAYRHNLQPILQWIRILHREVQEIQDERIHGLTSMTLFVRHLRINLQLLLRWIRILHRDMCRFLHQVEWIHVGFP
jgi:hypothetical protein